MGIRNIAVSLLVFSVIGCGSSKEKDVDEQLSDSDIELLEATTYSLDAAFEAVDRAKLGRKELQARKPSKSVSARKMARRLTKTLCQFSQQTKSDKLNGIDVKGTLNKVENANNNVTCPVGMEKLNQVSNDDSFVSQKLAYNVLEPSYKSMNDVYQMQMEHQFQYVGNGDFTSAEGEGYGSFNSQYSGPIPFEIEHEGSQLGPNGGLLRVKLGLRFKGKFKLLAEARLNLNSKFEKVGSFYTLNGEFLSEKEFRQILGSTFFNLIHTGIQ